MTSINVKDLPKEDDEQRALREREDMIIAVADQLHANLPSTISVAEAADVIAVLNGMVLDAALHLAESDEELSNKPTIDQLIESLMAQSKARFEWIKKNREAGVFDTAMVPQPINTGS